VDPEPSGFFNIGCLLQAQVSGWEAFLHFPWALLLLFLVLLALSFIVSSSEVAYLTLNDSELERLREDDSEAASRVLRMIGGRKAAERLLATILLTNNFVNVAAILVATSILNSQTQNLSLSNGLIMFLEVGVITFMLLLFGEIVPKKYARLNRVRLAKTFSLIMTRLAWVTSVPARLLTQSTNFISIQIEKRANENDTSIDDLKRAIDLTVSDEESKEEKEILKGIVNFGNMPVRSIMRARVDVEALEWNTPFEEVIAFINTHKFSRYPVYEDSLDQVKGILHIKALLPLLHQNQPDIYWQDQISDAYFVPENKKIDDLLEELKKRRLHQAIVVDEYGGTAGIVTLEDIIEEIFGEILDESDPIETVFRQIDTNEFIFEGRVPLHDMRKIARLDDEVFEDVRGDSDSLGGLILELNGKIPKAGEVVSFQHFDFFIEAASRSRIIRVKVVINQPVEKETE
jgi:putative hemolysin